MNVLIVGAGAVGAVYGRYLQLGGAEVGFFVKDKYAEACRKGFTFYHRGGPRSTRNTPIHMSGFSVLTTPLEVSLQKWDYVILTVSSTALQGPWLEDLLDAAKDAAIVTLQPGMHDYEYMQRRVPADRLIQSMIPIVSYLAPLPKESVPEPGVAYWIPPLTPAPFQGAPGRLEPLVGVFRKGGFPAKVEKNSEKTALVAGTALGMFIAALEAARWSFEGLRHEPGRATSRILELACRAMHQGVAILCKQSGRRIPVLSRYLLKPWFFSLLMRLSKFIVPFDFETYLKVHFTKVGDQMHQGMLDFIEAGEKENFPNDAIRQLAALNASPAKSPDVRL